MTKGPSKPRPENMAQEFPRNSEAIFQGLVASPLDSDWVTKLTSLDDFSTFCL